MPSDLSRGTHLNPDFADYHYLSVMSDAKQSSTYQELVRLGMPKLTAALQAKKNTYMVRAFLYICNCIGKINNLAEVVGGVDGAFAGALLDMANQSCESPSFEETAVLFQMLSDAFPSHLRVYVDYGMESGDVSDVLSRWRQMVTTNRGNGKKLPMGNLPCKTGLCAEDGEAHIWGRYTYIIDDHGRVMKTNPHDIAYDTENPDDIARAWHLQPKCPKDIQGKFINRSMARGAGLSLVDAPMLCLQRNFGVVRYLLESFKKENPECQAIGRKILKELCQWDRLQDEELVVELIKMGLIIEDLNERYLRSDSPFCCMIRYASVDNLSKILQTAKVRINPFRIEEVMKTVAGAIVCRYFNTNYRSDEFLELLDFWCELLESESLYEVDKETQKSWKLALCKEIIRVADDERGTFRSPECRDAITERIKRMEQSKQVAAFELHIAEVEHFPEFHRGRSRIEMSTRAQPVLKRLSDAYQAMTEAERNERKDTYENAIKFLRDAVSGR